MLIEDNPAIYILLAAECIEQIIHKAIIGLFLRILKDPDSVEYQLALRQLAIKDCDSNRDVDCRISCLLWQA
jgi:hypothetical protein